MLSRLEKFGLNLILFAKLLGTITIGLGFLSLLLVNRGGLKLNFRELLFTGAVLFQMAFSFILSGNLAFLTNNLFYFSFLLIYIYIKDKNTEDLIRFLRFMIVAAFLFTVVEFIVLNSPLTNYVWYFPENHIHRSEIMGFQRAQGLGAISSSSGAVAVLSLALYSVVSNKSLSLYGTIVFSTILLLMTGTGFFLFFVYIMLNILMNRGGIFRKTILWVGVIFLLGLLLFVFENAGLNRFTSAYFIEIYEFKLISYADNLYDDSILSIIFGGQSNARDSLILTSTDFGIMGLFDSMGLYSTILIIFAPLFLVGIKKQYLIVLILYWLAWLHYPAMGSPIGCVFFGVFLALCRNSVLNDQQLKITQRY